MVNAPPDPESGDEAGVPDHGGSTGTPRWVKVFGVIVVVVVLVVGIVLLTGAGGEHGPGRHMSPDNGGGQAPSGGGHRPPAGAPGHGGSQP